MISNQHLFKFLEKKLPNFAKTRKAKTGEWLFTCANLDNHKFKTKSPTATFTPSGSIACLICGWKGSLYDVVRVLEIEYKNKSDAEITAFLIDELKLNMYQELDAYEKYGWSLLPLLKNTRDPFETGWRKKEYTDKVQWIKWLNNGFNVGVNCELSKITVIDVDCKNSVPAETKENREKIIKLLEEANTLKATTPSGGMHYVFKWEEELRKPQIVNLAGTQIDTRTEGQIAAAPSIRNGIPYKWENLGAEIKEISPELKTTIKNLMKTKTEYPTTEEKIEASSDLKNNDLEGCRNNTLVSIGGMLVKKLDPQQTEFVLNIMNRNLLKNPLPSNEIKAMLGSLTNYKGSDEETYEKIIYDYLKLMQSDVTPKDIIDSTRLPRSIVDKYLSKFVKDGKAIRMGRGRYQYKEKIEWSDAAPQTVQEYEHEIPLFNNLMIFQQGDVLILGAKTNAGKTTIALNMLREMINQGVKPYYIYSEAGSRFQTTGEILGITGRYYHTFHENPLAIELEYNAFSVIDWLHLENKAETDNVLKKLNDELHRKGGILVIFSQLKQDNTWFAPNLIDHYPTFASRYFQNDEKTEGYWHCDKIKEPRGDFVNYTLPCVFNKKTRIFKVKDLI